MSPAVSLLKHQYGLTLVGRINHVSVQGYNLFKTLGLFMFVESNRAAVKTTLVALLWTFYLESAEIRLNGVKCWSNF